MPISEFPIFSMLRTKMQWHQERQRVLAENVANSDTPNYVSRELVPPKFDGAPGALAPVALVQTSASHIGANPAGTPQFPSDRKGRHEIRPSGNAVNLEEEMIKVAANQMDYQAATTLYTKGLALIKIALK